MGWVSVAVVVVGLLYGWYLLENPPDTNYGAPDVSELTVSPAKYGLPIADVLGITKLTGNIVGYWDEKSVRITKEVADGKDTKDVVTGYTYYLTWAMGICMGPVDTLYAVYKGNDLVWQGELNRPASGGEETIVLTGMGSMTLYFGTDDQAANSTLAGKLKDSTLNPPYRNICWAFFNNCKMGTQNRLPTLKFVIRKTPVLTFNSNNVLEKYNYNPAHACWHILVDMAGMPSSYLDSDSFSAVANVLNSEDRGVGILFSRQASALTYLESIFTHINGVLRYNYQGKFYLKLIRDDVPIENLPVIYQDDVLEDIGLSRKSWLDTTNEIQAKASLLARGKKKASYYHPGSKAFYFSAPPGTVTTEGGIDFKTDTLILADPGHIKTIGRVNSKTITLSIFNTEHNVEWAADRILRAGSYPIASFNIVVNRNLFALEAGDAFVLNYIPYNIVNMACRVIQIREAELESEEITISAMEDVNYISSLIGA